MKELHVGDVVKVGYLRLLVVKMGVTGFNLLDMDDYTLVNQNTAESPEMALKEFCDNSGVPTDHCKLAGGNPFKEYTDYLADVLQDKNLDYGDSFSESIDKHGLIAAVVRLEDKLNRLDNLTATHDQHVEDESLEDTALDISGYGILLYKYLKERDNENN